MTTVVRRRGPVFEAHPEGDKKLPVSSRLWIGRMGCDGREWDGGWGLTTASRRMGMTAQMLSQLAELSSAMSQLLLMVVSDEAVAS